MIGGYYRFYPGDYFRDTSGLTMLEHGAYNLLLHNYYAACGKLEYEKPRVYEMCHARTPEDIRAVDYILSKFFRVDNGVLTNNRADEELAERARYFETQRRNGLLGGRPKKNPRVSKLSTGSGVAPKSPKITQNNPRVNSQPPGNETESGEKAEKNAQKKTPPAPAPGPGPLKEKEKAVDLNTLSVGLADGANAGGDGFDATPPAAPPPRDPVLEAQEHLIEARRARGIPESGRTEPLQFTK